MKKHLGKALAIFLAVVLALPLGMFATLGVFAETTDDTATTEKAKYTEPTLTSSKVAYFSWTGKDANDGLSASKMKQLIGSAWNLVPNGGTLVIPAKGWVNADTTLSASSTVLITAKDTNGTIYFDPANPDVAQTNQKGMLMVEAAKTLTFNSDVIFDDVVILQRNSPAESKIANIKISNNSTLVIGENVQFLTYNTSWNTKLTVDDGSTLVIKAGGAHSYNGKGTIYLDRNLVGNGIEASQFSGFLGDVYDLDGNYICELFGHGMTAKLVDGEYISACAYCGHTDNEAFIYTIPTVASTDVAYWGHDTKLFVNTVGSSVKGVAGGAPLMTALPNGGTVYSVQKGYVSDSVRFKFNGTTRFTAVLPDNFAEAVGYAGDIELNLDLREKDITGATAAEYGSIMTHTGCFLRFESDVIFENINFYCRTNPAPTYSIGNGATAVFSNVNGLTTVSLRPILEVRAGGIAILLGDNVGGFGSIIGNGTIVVDNALFRSGKLNSSVFADFEGTVMTTDYEEVCALTGNHSVVGGECENCGWVDGASIKIYVAHDAKGDGSSPNSPSNSMRVPFTKEYDAPVEIVLVDDLIIDGGIECEGNSQDITITSMDVDGDGVYPKLIIRSFIVFNNSGAGNTIKFENIEIQSKRSGSVPLFFCYNNVEFGENVTCTLSGDFEDGTYPILYAGYLGNQSSPANTVEGRSNDCDTTFTVKSGTFASFVGGNRKNLEEYAIGINKGKMTVNVEGGTFIGDASGISLTGCGFNFAWGDIALNISGGTFYGDIYGIGSNGQYGGSTPYGEYGYKSDVDINITGGTIGGNIYAKYNNIKIPALLRGDVNVAIGADVIITDKLTVDLRGTVAYEGDNKVSTLTFDEALAGQITAKFVDFVNGTETGDGEPIRIAFVGDSITQGTGATDFATQSYPAQLQAMLNSDEYMVGNFGVAASGVLPSTKYYYNNTLQYHLLMEEFDPTIVSFALGTNDSLAAGGVYGVAVDFENRYYSLVEGVANIYSVDKIYVATPILRLDSPSRQARNVSIIEPAIRSIVAKLNSEGYNATVFELNANTYEAVLAGNVLGTDNLHPGNDGYAVMAEAFYNAIFGGVVDVPDGYYVDTFYVSDNGSLAGTGTADDPSTHYEVGLARLNKTGGTLILLDSYTIASDIVTPVDIIGKISIKGATADSVLNWSGNTLKFGSDFEIDDLKLVTKAEGPVIVGWYHNATIGENFTNVTNGKNDLVFVAGYLTYQNQALEGAVNSTTYDTVESASSSNNVSIVIKNGTYGAIVLGNRRMSDKALVGMYSGNMTAHISGVTITGSSDYASGAMTMMNLSGTIDVVFDSVAFINGAKFYGATRTATLTGVIYDSSLNTGSVSVSAKASILQNSVVLSERAVGNAQYAHLANFNLISTTDKGDMDEDGIITNADITLLIRVLSGWKDVSYANYSADVNADSKLNNRDALEIIKILATVKE